MALTVTLVCETHIPQTNIQIFDNAVDLEKHLCMEYDEEKEIDIFIDGENVYTASPGEFLDLAFLNKYFK